MRKWLFSATALLISYVSILSSPSFAFDEKETKEVETIIREYLLENPEIMLEVQYALQEKMEAKKTLQDVMLIETYNDLIYDDGFSYVAGNLEGDVTIVEFIDYQCGYCKKAHKNIKKLLENDGNIKFIIKEFPVLGPLSIAASKALLASKNQDDGKYYIDFHNALLETKQRLSEKKIYSIAKKIGLEIDQLKKDMKSEEIEDNIQETYKLAAQLDITGTPGFIIGDSIIRGSVPYETFVESVKKAREEKK